MHLLKSFWADFIDLLYPRCCDACHRPLEGNEEVLCTICLVDLPRMTTDSSINPALLGKFIVYPQILSVNAFLVFSKKGKVQSLLHGLKYRGREEIGEKLGILYGTELLDRNAIPRADFIITVPLHKKKKKVRGYNQCDAFAKGLSLTTGIPCALELLVRVKNTTTQTGKSKQERRVNMQDVFRLSQASVAPPKRIILIDDVMTTGATMEACIVPLIQHPIPCEEIHIITIAASHH